MRVEVCPRIAVERLFTTRKLDSRVAIISIHSPPQGPPEYDASIHSCHFLPLGFHDIEGPIEVLSREGDWPVEKYQEFTPELAKRATAFAKRIFQPDSGVKLFICHCDAGVSRSAAMVAAIHRFFIGDDSIYFKTRCPNSLVYRLMLQELYGAPVDGTSYEEVFSRIKQEQNDKTQGDE